jgi:hypothetical protein
MKKFLISLTLLMSVLAQAQSVDGYWYGNANVRNGGGTNNYLVELILNQRQNSVSGIINYYFKNTFRSFKINGVYTPASRQLQFFDIPVTYFGSTSRMEVDCIMNLVAQLRVAKAGSSLNGSLVGTEKYKYTCPEIGFSFQLNKEANNKDSILTALRQFKESYQLWTPSATDTAVAATVIQRPIINYVVANQFKERTKVFAEDIAVASDSLQVDFYDNGEIDGDSISIFFNDKLLASSQKLSAKAIHLNIALDSTREYNEISMFADNLGSIPPNTALMLVYDGKQRYEIRLSSTLQNNGTLRIRRKK